MEYRISNPLLLGFFFLIASTISLHNCFAEDMPAAKAQTQASGTERTEDPSMIVDPEANAFRFFIDGKEVARIDARGLKVRENIEYGGTASDVGVGSYDQEDALPEGAAE